MSETPGILSYGVYLPRTRLQRAAIYKAHAWFAPHLKALAKGERAAANWDEDSITMGVEAARDALDQVDRGQIASLCLASTTLPFADRLNAGVVKEALNLRDEVRALDFTGGQRAGTSALIEMLEGQGNAQGPALCIAAEMRKARPASEAELNYGDASVAFVIGKGEPCAKFVAARSVTVDFVDHFRASGVDTDYFWESRWIRDEGYTRLLGDALQNSLASFGVAAADIAHAVIAIPAPAAVQSLAKKIGLRPEALSDTLASSVGDAGVAHPLLLLAATLDRAKAGERILLVSFGQGVDIVLLEATATLERAARRATVATALAGRRPDENYPRFLFHRGQLDLERGMRAEFDQKQPGTTLYRHRKAVFALVGGRSTKTGTVQFPKSTLSVDPDDPSPGTQEDYPLADRPARVVTYTADHLTYSPDPPACYGMVDFDGGGRLIAEFADANPADIEVGDPVRMVFRIKAIDEMRHFKRYFWKAMLVGRKSSSEKQDG
jgi:hydroxymethylglutaryl-CoA synthase